MPQWKKNMWIFCVSFFVIDLTYSMVMPFLPLFLVRDLGVTDPVAVKIWTGFIFGISYLSMIVFGPLWGWLGDKYGRKSMVIRSGIGLTIALALMALATNAWQMFLLRLLNGALCGFFPAANAMTATNTPQKQVGMALGLIMAGAMGGTVLGPVLGGAFITWFSFRAAFVFSAILCAIITVMSWIWTKEIKKPNPSQERAGFLLGLKLAFHTRPLPAVFILGTITQFALMGTNAFLSIYIQEFALGPHSATFYITVATAVTGVASVFGAPFIGRYADRVGAEKMVALCMLLMGSTLALQSFAASFGQFLLFRFLFGLAIGGVSPSFNTLISKYSPWDMEGRFFSYNNSFFNLGMLLGSTMGGWISVAFGTRGLFFGCSMMLLCCFAWVKVNILNKMSSFKTMQGGLDHGQHFSD